MGGGFDYTLNFLLLIFKKLNFNNINGLVLKSNKYAIINALFFGAKITGEVIIDNKDFYVTIISKSDFLVDLENKSDNKQFAKFVYAFKQRNSLIIKK